VTINSPIPEPTTTRLRLLNPMPAHVEPLAELFADPDTMRYIGSGVPWTRDDIARRLDRGMQLNADGHPYFWTVVRADSNEVIGQGGLVPITFNGPETELGYRLGQPHWGQGFATEIARAAVECALTPTSAGGLGLDRLVAVCYEDNLPSRRVLAKAGFRELGPTTLYYNVRSILHELCKGTASHAPKPDASRPVPRA
jgi:RimJ/RimL family protein N-acetyltransferase